MKLNYKKTFLLGFGFFAISLTWSIYNSFVPVFLKNFITANWLIGFIMTLDNYAGIIIQPLFGYLSDNTNTKFGRRIPYLLFGMPLASIFLIIIPLHFSLPSLILFIVCLNVTMASFRSPTIALMPDITAEPLRSKANGIINLMGGIGAVVAYFIGSKLYMQNKSYPFFMAAILLIISIIILYKNIKEKRDSLNYNTNPQKKGIKYLIKNFKASNKDSKKISIPKNTIFMLCAILCWFIAFNAVESFFSLYGKEYLKINEAIAASKFTFFSLSMVVFAIPAGLIATKIGKKKTIIIGLILMILSFAGLVFANDINKIGYVFIFSGMCWALININSYPLIVSMTNNDNIGTFTGYYYFASSLAAIISPPLAGKLIDILGYSILFKYTLIFFILALIFMFMVKQPNETSDISKVDVSNYSNLEI